MEGEDRVSDTLYYTPPDKCASHIACSGSKRTRLVSFERPKRWKTNPPATVKAPGLNSEATLWSQGQMSSAARLHKPGPVLRVQLVLAVGS